MYEKDFEKLSATPRAAMIELQDVSENDLLSITGSDTPPKNIAHENYQQQPQQPQTQSQPITGGQRLGVGELINPSFAVDILDEVAPLLLSLVLGAVGCKVPKRSLQATEKQKELLQQPMGAILAELKIDTSNPWNAFFASLAAVYGTIGVAAYVKYQGERQTPEFGQEFDENGHLVPPKAKGRGAGQMGKKRGPYKKREI